METKYIILIVAGVVAVDLFVTLFVVLRTRRSGLEAEMTAELAGCGETLLAAPEAGSFRGAKFDYGKVKCDGVIAATEKRLIFRKLIGARVEVPLSDVVDVKAEKSFLHARRLGVTHLVLHTREGNEIGFFVRDVNRWIDLLRGVMAAKT